MIFAGWHLLPFFFFFLTYFSISGIDFPEDYYSACALLCIRNCAHAIFSLPPLSHPHSRALRGSAWQCKPDLGSSVSAGMNNSPCSGWRAPANGRHALEQTAGLPLMSLSGLSQIVFLVLNHPFPPAPSPHSARSLGAANGLDSVTAQRHLLIKTDTQLHQCKLVFNAFFKGVHVRAVPRSPLHAPRWCVDAARTVGEILPSWPSSYFNNLCMKNNLSTWIIQLRKHDEFVQILWYICVLELGLCCTLIWKIFPLLTVNHESLQK